MTPTEQDKELREKLAAIEHERWAEWQKWVHKVGELHQDEFGNDDGLLIPDSLYRRWSKQIATPYAELSEAEKNSDREQVDRYWGIVEQFIATHDQQLLEAILDGADYGVCTGGEWSNEKKKFVCDHNHSGIVPVEHIKSVFKKEGE